MFRLAKKKDSDDKIFLNHTGGKKSRRRKRGKRIELKEILLWSAEIIAVSLFAAGIVWSFGQKVINSGDAMSPVLYNGDEVLLNCLIYDIRMPERGEVIAFDDEHGHNLLRRVVGLPGETVQIEDGEIYIDGEIQKEDIYVSEIEYAGNAEEEITLGEDEFFVIGDNHTGSDDSRMDSIGIIKKEDIFGKAWYVAGNEENAGLIN